MTTKPAPRPPLEPHHVAGALLIGGILAFNIYRAVNQSITHDEALTYNAFVAEGWRVLLFSFDSNNHVLHSALMRVSTGLLGLSHFSVRLPALLGGLIYLLAVERFCRAFCRNKLTYLLTLAAASLSPFILDYLVLARGYSLALGLLMSTVWLASKEVAQTTAAKRPRWRSLALISGLCGLAAAANLAFAFPAAALLLGLLAWVLGQGSRPGFAMQAACLVLPSGLLFLAANPTVIHFNPQQMYFGAENWRGTWRSLSGAVFEGSTASGLALLLLPVVLVGGALQLKSLRHNADKPNSRLWLFLAAIVGLTLLLHSLARAWFGALLPLERTGIYFIPLLLLLIALAIEALDGGLWSKALRWGGQALLAVVVLSSLANLRSEHFRGREYDARSREIYLALRSLDIQRDSQIGINWLMEPSLNFYRSYFGDAFMPRFSRQAPTGREDFFVLLPGDAPEDQRLIEEFEIQIVYAEAFSGAVLGTIK